MNKPAFAIGAVRDVVGTLLPTGHPTLVMVADQLQISPRTLQRRLKENRLMYSQLVNQVRLAKACQLLAQEGVSVSDVAGQTGFASPSGFSRAFQSWTGTSPRVFRRGIFVVAGAIGHDHVQRELPVQSAN